eukprot:5700294-Pleurochrysis_carterae.AAC.1
MVPVAQTGSGAVTDHNLDAPVVSTVWSDMHDLKRSDEGSKGPKLRHPRTVSGCIRYTQRRQLKYVAAMYATNTAVESVAFLHQQVSENHTKTVAQTCLYGHSPNQSLLAHAGCATGSDHNLHASVVCKFCHTCMKVLVSKKSGGPNASRPSRVAPGLSGRSGALKGAF